MLGLLGRLHEDHVVVAPEHLDVGADPAGGRQEQGAAGAPRRKPGDIGGEEIVQPRDRVGALDAHLAPIGQVDEPAALEQRGEIVREGSVVGHPPRRPLSAS